MTYSIIRPNAYVLRISSPAASGLVSAVTAALAATGASIDELQQYDDEESRRFFMRCVFTTAESGRSAEDVLGPDWATKAEAQSMSWEVRRTDRKKRVLILVSKSDHCLRDLLYRWEWNELSMDVVGIVSNHQTLSSIAARHGVPFDHIPVSAEGKLDAEEALRRIVAERRADLVILARYMQVLSDGLCRSLDGKCINIHHSFLPSFKGGSPYTQAHTRGVKLIGATAHYVTGALDEGPIIEQEVRRIDHRYAVPEMQSLGRDIEASVLAKAVRLHLEDRVFVVGNKTVVFS